MARPLNFILLLIYAYIFLDCNPSEITKLEEQVSKPNIILIYADDMGYGEIEALNPERSKIPTPHLNQLAEEGMVFTDAHTTSSVCTPSRYALLTGRYNWRTRLQSGVVTGGNEPLIAADRMTLPDMLQSQGYSTAMVGKWHLEYRYEVPESLKNNERTKSTEQLKPAPYPVGTRILEGPVTRGFNSFFGFHHSREMSSMVRNDEIIEELEVSQVLPRLTSEVVKLIDQKAEASKKGIPFFIYFAQNSPHTPIAPSKTWQGRTDLGAYGDFVAETDGSVGSVLEALERNGIERNTIVIFSADNGTSRAANIESLQSKGHYPSAQFRGSKSDIWDGGHRVPFMVRWPGVTPSETENDQLICLSDMMATFAEQLGVKLPDNSAEDSWSFLAAIKGKVVKKPRINVVHHSINGRFSVREGDWKLILAPGSGGWTAPNDIAATKKGLPSYQLYYLQEDIGEKKNLIEKYPEKAKSMIELLKQYIAEGRSTPGSIQKNDADIDIFKNKLNL